jgi:hypothetical protein
MGFGPGLISVRATSVEANSISGLLRQDLRVFHCPVNVDSVA